MEFFEKDIAVKYGLDTEAIRGFAGHLERTEVGKSEFLVEKGCFDDNFYMLKEGILRAFIPTADGEQTLWFGYPGQVVFDVWCYHYRKPSRITIEAADYEQGRRLRNRHWQRLCCRRHCVGCVRRFEFHSV